MKRRSKAQESPGVERVCLNCGKPVALVTMTSGAQAGQQVWVHLTDEGAQRLTCRKVGNPMALPHARWFDLG